ncbi:hypothetical protein [Mesorhizobium silamurunense]|uniref:hypothetical protein n=1 Tax=Mesorhizobium silamurunense TaxID=499528 RepID=UPI001785A969|nr:hypothetical protein [Mesorhizobium silamurunense]
MGMREGYFVTAPHTGMRACNCIGPQNGDPVCPCKMPAYNREKAGERALQFFEEIFRSGGAKPRVRRKAGRREI